MEIIKGRRALTDGRIGLKEKSPILVADIVRMCGMVEPKGDTSGRNI